MGNDPNGVHVYIDTGLHLFTVTSSLLSMLKTIAIVVIEHNVYSCSFVDYCMTLLRLESLEVQGVPGNRSDSCRSGFSLQ